MTSDDPLAPPPGYVHDEGGKPLDDTRCDVREAPTFLLPAGQRCTRDGNLRIWFGCEREHMGFADVCSGHRFAVLSGFPANCARCQDAGEPSRSVIIKQGEAKGNNNAT